MYETFCSSYKFFAKLVERYHIPESAGYSEGAIRELRLRICSILTKWIKKKFFGLDTFTKEKIELFISTTLADDGYSEMSSILEEIIQQKLEDEKRISNSFFQPIPKIPNVDSGESLYSAFLLSDEKLIAEQLTLHDWKIFCRIKVGNIELCFYFLKN